MMVLHKLEMSFRDFLPGAPKSKSQGVCVCVVCNEMQLSCSKASWQPGLETTTDHLPPVAVTQLFICGANRSDQ